jgi:transglycosylase-like protein with SLT domain
MGIYFVIVVLVAMSLFAAHVGRAQTADMAFETFKQKRIGKRVRANSVRDRHCRPPVHRFATRHTGILPWRRRENLDYWDRVVARVIRESTRCLSAEGIIRFVFPGSTEGAAVSVAYCESRLSPRAQNPSSGAAGLFQLMPFHWSGRFDPFDPWANTRYAYRLSDAGFNWGAWVCKP